MLFGFHNKYLSNINVKRQELPHLKVPILFSVEFTPDKGFILRREGKAMRQRYQKNKKDRMMVKCLVASFFILTVFNMHENIAEACPACLVGAQSGHDHDSKALAALRKTYEEQGEDAIPYIRKVLKTSKDPLVIKRAANYLVVLNDTASIPYFESMLLDLVKNEAPTKFGSDTAEFQSRLSVAHALIKMRPTTVTDRIWESYDRLDRKRKEEVPYILNALKDPHLDERMIIILNLAEDHQLMQGALEALATGGSDKILPYLRSKIEAWRNRSIGTGTNPRPGAPAINYSRLIFKAEITIHYIGNRFR